MRTYLRWVPLVVFVITLIEVLLLVRIGKLLGFGVLVAWLVVAALAGLSLFRYARRPSARGEDRGVTRSMAEELADRAILSAAAVLLIIPGFLSDLVALALLAPGNRRALARGLMARFGAVAANEPFATDDRADQDDGRTRRKGEQPAGTPVRMHGRVDGRVDGRMDGQVIEGEFTRRDETSRPKP